MCKVVEDIVKDFVADEKKTALINMFAKPCVSRVYGSVGMGKSTLIGYLSAFHSLANPTM